MEKLEEFNRLVLMLISDQMSNTVPISLLVLEKVLNKGQKTVCTEHYDVILKVTFRVLYKGKLINS